VLFRSVLIALIAFFAVGTSNSVAVNIQSVTSAKGIKALLAAFQGIGSASKITPAKKPRTLLNAFFEGFLTNALNPKVSMFYLAAFPQFITLGETTAASAFLLVFLHSMINLVWFGAMVVLFAKLTAVASNGSFQRWLKGVTGVVFIGFGIKLATFRPNL